MQKPIIKLYPQPGGEQPLKGTYLAHDLRQFAAESRAFVYTNFVASLDGRIAVNRGDMEGMKIPQSIANDRDWWLFQELATQADVIISSGRYLQDWDEGNAQEILQKDDPLFAELRDWRRARNLPPHADIAIVSASLDFPIPDVLTADGRKVIIYTTSNPDPERVSAMEKKAGQVIIAGDSKSVDGASMIEHLTGLGYRTIFSSAGPKILYLLLASNMLDRLYITHASRIIGGDTYASIVEGALLRPAVDLSLSSAYLDPTTPDGLNQLFMAYDRTRSSID